LSARRAIAGGCALGFAVGWNVANVGAVAETIADDYDVGLEVVGLFTTGLFVTHAAFQIPAGRAVDRLGARRVGFASLAVLALANALALVAPEPGLLLGLRVLAGLGTALGFIAGSDYVRAHGGSAFAQGLYGGLALGAGGFGLALVPQAANWLEWRAPFATALALTACAGIVLGAGPPDVARRVGRVAVPGEVTAAGRAPRLLRDSRLYRLCAIYTASFGLAVVLGNWVVPLLTRAGDYSEELAGAVGSLILLGGVVSRPLGGWIVRHRPDRVRVALASSFAASAGGTLVLAVAGPPVLSVVGALVLGLASGIPFAASFGAAARVRPDAPAAAVAMVNMAANLVVVAGTPLLGLTFALPGDGRIGFLATIALWVAALLVVPGVRELESHREAGSPG
jgi:MFS family permease